jgi:RNA polymerase sigma factor for flagellar operon FliA
VNIRIGAGQVKERPMAKTRTTTAAVEQDINEVWKKFKANKTEVMRNLLMMEYLPLVRYNADRIYSKLPDEVDLDDLIQAGTFGLKDAIESFDPNRGVKFETYCAPRIRGAILDELRNMDWVPRLVRSRSSKVIQASRQLEMKLGRAPTHDEIAAHLGVPPDEFDKMLKDSSAVSQVSLSRKWFESDSDKDVREVDVLQDKSSDSPLTILHQRDIKDLITRGLSRSEKMILVLYYYEEMTMKEIGDALELSESRVSQMHSSIIARLRSQLANREKEFSTD